jgi:HAE1 family hydrophobic/amphiphilic exporter-1
MASSVAQPLERSSRRSRPVADDLDQFARLDAITLQFDLNRNIDGAANDVQAAINAAGGQLPKNLPSPPTYRKVNPADSPILMLSAHSDTLPLTRSTTTPRTSSRSRSPDLRRRPGRIGGQQKPRSASRSIRPSSPRWAAAGGRAHRHRRATVDAPKGSIDGPKRASPIYANDQLLKAKPWNDVIVAYRNGAPVRIRDIGRRSTGRRNQSRRPGQNGKRGVHLLWSSSSPAPTSSTPSTRSRRAAALQARSRRRSRSTSSRPHRRPSAPRSRTSSSRCC